jgi:hypothetical protein
VSVEFLPANIHYTDGTSTIGQVATPHKTIKSVDTGALVLEVAGNVPSQGGVSVTYTLGRVTIAAADAPGPAVPPVNAAPAVQGPPMAGALAPTTVGPVDEPQGAVPPVIGRSSDGAVANPEVAVGIPALETKPPPSMAGLYLLFVAAAAAILLLARAGRLLAARSKHGP